MTNRQVVSKLRELGHRVGVYVRKDGSIRITSIDGVKYSSRLSEGVAAGRDLLRTTQYWDSTEEARVEKVAAQRRAARSSRMSGQTLKSQSKEFQREFKQFQREIKKVNKRLARQGKKGHFGISWEATKKGAQRAGISVEQQLRRAEDYFRSTAQGIAPSQMVQELIDKLNLYLPKYPELQVFLNIIEPNKTKLDIYETKNTINWLYGYVQEVKQSETLLERAVRLRATIHND